jgi:hypothetical protein
MADIGQIAEAAAELALAGAVTIALGIAQSKYNDIASDYYTLYKIQRDFYFDNFQLSGEAPFATEQFGVPFYVPDYVGTFHAGYLPPGVWNLYYPQALNRISALGTPSSNGYWKRYGSRYNAPQEQGGSYFMDLANTLDDWASYQNRYEEHKRDIFNERRWASQMGSLSYGVKEAYTVERGLGTSFQVFDEAAGQLISEDSTILNGLSTFAGYRQMQKALREDLGTVPQYQSSSFLTNVAPN